MSSILHYRWVCKLDKQTRMLAEEIFTIRKMENNININWVLAKWFMETPILESYVLV